MYIATVYNQLQYNKVCKINVYIVGCFYGWKTFYYSSIVEVDPGNLKGEVKSGDTCIMYAKQNQPGCKKM